MTHTSPLSVRIRKQLVSRDVPIWQHRAPAQGWPVVFVSGNPSVLIAHIELLAGEAGAVYGLEARDAGEVLLFSGEATAETSGPQTLAIAASLQRALAGHVRLVRQPLIWTLWTMAHRDRPTEPLLERGLPSELYWVSSDVATSFGDGIPIELLRMLADDANEPLVRQLARRAPGRVGELA